MQPDVDPELHTIPPDRGPMEAQPKWRRDFPIDTPQDGYVARRDFTKFMGLTSLGLVVGQFWIALQNRRRARQGKLPSAPTGRTTLTIIGDITFIPRVRFNRSAQAHRRPKRSRCQSQIASKYAM